MEAHGTKSTLSFPYQGHAHPLIKTGISYNNRPNYHKLAQHFNF